VVERVAVVAWLAPDLLQQEARDQIAVNGVVPIASPPKYGRSSIVMATRRSVWTDAL
jgi:hypothetical protein